MILGDHGARVITIEHRRYRKEYLSTNRSINRNKEHMTLDLKTDKGKEIFYSLARKADVILEGFRPGVMDRLKVGYHAIRELNPEIIYCSITGYGQNGPWRDQAGHDINYLGHSGMLSTMCSEEGAPCIPGVQIADMAGGLNAAIGIILALLARETTGKGQYIDIAMTDGLISMLPIAAGMLWGQGSVPSRGKALLYQRYACYNVYKTADGAYVTLGALERRFWDALCRYFDVAEYMPLQFSEEKRAEIIEFFSAEFLKRTRDEWMKIFSDNDVCLGGVLTVKEALSGENIEARDMVVPLKTDEIPTEKNIGIPVKLSATPGGVRSPSPEFGANTRSILGELGFTDADVTQLESEGVI